MKLLKTTLLTLAILASLSAQTPTHTLEWFTKQDTQCLLQNLHHEARGETLRGQILVTKVLLNRANGLNLSKSTNTGQGLKHSTICSEMLKPKQFSWTSSKKKKQLKVKPSLDQMEVLYAAKQLEYDATHYHATYVKPKWATKLAYIETEGNHRFYK